MANAAANTIAASLNQRKHGVSNAFVDQCHQLLSVTYPQVMTVFRFVYIVAYRENATFRSNEFISYTPRRNDSSSTVVTARHSLWRLYLVFLRTTVSTTTSTITTTA